jgi:hypothetical protein
VSDIPVCNAALNVPIVSFFDMYFALVLESDVSETMTRSSYEMSLFYISGNWLILNTFVLGSDILDVLLRHVDIFTYVVIKYEICATRLIDKLKIVFI